MHTTITRDRSSNGATADRDVSEAVRAPESAGGEGPPRIVRDSNASFALFASFVAVLMALAALLAVAFRLDNTGTVMRAHHSTATPAHHAAPAAPPVASGSAGSSMQIKMGDYSFSPQNATAAAGKVKISAVNDGRLPHELVLARTNADPSQLPTTPDGSVDEAKLKSPGEIADVAAGATKQGTLNLPPGHYVMFCNLPGHYAAGMYGTFTVK